jgi:hypothetical protein
LAGTRSAKGYILYTECHFLPVCECDIIVGAMSHFVHMKCHLQLAQCDIRAVGMSHSIPRICHLSAVTNVTYTTLICDISSPDATYRICLQHVTFSLEMSHCMYLGMWHFVVECDIMDPKCDIHSSGKCHILLWNVTLCAWSHWHSRLFKCHLRPHQMWHFITRCDILYTKWHIQV